LFSLHRLTSRLVSAASTDSYLESKLTHPEYAGDTSLQRGQERAQEAGMPQIAVSAMQGQMLSVIAKSMGAEKILEIGALAG
jgi:predicted O-methyltransferase YrrM